MQHDSYLVRVREHAVAVAGLLGVLVRGDDEMGFGDRRVGQRLDIGCVAVLLAQLPDLTEVQDPGYILSKLTPQFFFPNFCCKSASVAG